MKKLAIITTHPIQYNAPWFKLLAERKNIIIKVFYTWSQVLNEEKYDPGFGKNIEWDIPLLDGYDYTFVKNVARSAGSHHFKGIDNPTLINEITSWNPDGILVFGWSFKSHLKVLRHFKSKVKILFRGDSNLIDDTIGFSVKKIIRKIFLKWVYRHVDFALYVGSENKAYYKKFGLKENQLFFAPHAIDNSRFMQDSSGNYREQMGIPKDATVFLFIGKFEDKKNPHLLVDAFIKLTTINTHLLMVGNGVLENEFKNKVAELPNEVKSRIHFLPFQNQLEMPSIYRIGNILVLPSKGPGETWGLAVNEAMACKRAILVSDKCGCAVDLVKAGINGYSFKSNDISDLLFKMNLFLNDTEAIEEMGNQSYLLVKNWNFDIICNTIEKSIYIN